MPDSAGRLVSATDGDGTTYVSSADYNADNSPKISLLGHSATFAGITSSFLYNPRLQLCRITAWTSGSVPSSCVDPAAHGNLMDRSYNFSLGSADNGNVMSITNYRDSSRTQTFTYDALNRITSGWSTAGTGALSWGENYAVDAWGNLQMSPMAGKASGGNFQCAGDGQNHATCLGYDAAGNVTANGGASYTYDQENRISSTAGMTYAYDADGTRVEKSSGSTGTLYWYGAPGIIAETDLSGTLKSEYVFFSGKRVARIDSPGNTVHYYLSDHLNSTSMVVSAAGVTEEESDYSPFGTEYQVTSSGANHYKFTGKERDTESQLDYFGARYYSNGLGRFITPDWAAKAAAVPYAEFADPQSLNLYSYVRNIPTTRYDADGHCADGFCKDIKIKAEVDQKPKIVKNVTIKDVNGNTVAKATGVQGKLVDTVTSKNKPLADVKVTEKNEQKVTVNGKDQPAKLVEGKATTNQSGQFGDTIGALKSTSGSSADNKSIEHAFATTPFTVTDKQTLTLTFSNGAACEATSTRTLTNVGPDGNASSHFSLTTTQPAVKDQQ